MIRLRAVPLKFEVGDRITDSRGGRPVTGTVTRVKGNSVYYRDDCGYCRDGAHHRTQADFSTTAKADHPAA